ncbi:SRPBCC family protein [Roseiflexus castenholzii]|nr:hypothetical protein [Roseiflexus castenholzii]
MVAENFFACYHCSHTHPEFCSVMSYGRALDTRNGEHAHAAFVAEWEQTAAREGWRTGGVAISDAAVHQIQRTPIRRGYLTQSKEWRASCAAARTVDRLRRRCNGNTNDR